jgi:hypothetical protein
VLPFHDAAGLFPLLYGADYEDLKSDIRTNGLREPLWTYQGQVIDGRNRARVCEDLGIDPATREWDGQGSLVAFIVSLNLHRRHLTSSQRAAVAAEMLPMLEQEAKDRQRTHAGTAPGRKGTLGQKVDGVNGRAAQQAAKLAGTNRQYVSSAKRILEAAPDLHEQVKAGKLKVTQAREQLQRREAEARYAKAAAEAVPRPTVSCARWIEIRAEVRALPEFVAHAKTLRAFDEECSRREAEIEARIAELTDDYQRVCREFGAAQFTLSGMVEEEVRRSYCPDCGVKYKGAGGPPCRACGEPPPEPAPAKKGRRKKGE